MKPIIFVVEDDAALQELYMYSLENDCSCRCFDDGAALFEELLRSLPALIILDIMLPGEDGFAILARLKSDERYKHIPVIIISAKGEELSKVKGLNMGADDYIAKPFGVLELAARVKANLRKKTAPPKQTIVYKDIIVDTLRHRITVNGYPFQATLKVHKLLQLLCTNHDKVQSRDEIFKGVWGESVVVETRTLDNHIKDLRKMLSEAGSTAEIHTVRGVGYIMQ